MLLGFDWASWYGLAIAVAAGITTFGGATVLVVSGWRYLSHRLNPAPAPQPDVVLGHPGAQISLTPSHELSDGEYRRLVSVRPMYLIENKDPARAIRNVSMGARTRNGAHEHVFNEFHAPLIGAGETLQFMAEQSIPVEWLADVHESIAQAAFLYWIKFELDGRRWEVIYDPETRSCAAQFI
jgi:hypothetical protein